MSDQGTTAVEPQETLEALTALARERGAVEVASTPIGLLGEYYHATAYVITAEGQRFERAGYAKPGDAQGEADDVTCPPPQRAEIRALRAAIRLAYGREVADGQPNHVRMAQAAVRRAAEALGRSRDEVAAELHAMLRVDSLNELSPEQASYVAAWCQGMAAAQRGAGERRAEPCGQS